jgi:L-threonate 2-dehydrogenase
MDKTVGLVGLGIMGGAIARNLVDRGWHVIGYDIDPARCSELAQADVTIAGDVGQLTRDTSIVMTSLPTRPQSNRSAVRSQVPGISPALWSS